MIEELKEELAQIIMSGKTVAPRYRAQYSCYDPLSITISNANKRVEIDIPDKFLDEKYDLEKASEKLLHSSDFQDMCYARSLVGDIATTIYIRRAKQELYRLDKLWRQFKGYKSSSHNKVSKELYRLIDYRLRHHNVDKIMPIATSLCQVLENKSLPSKQIQQIINNFIERY
jgi:hypothetical protein